MVKHWLFLKHRKNYQWIIVLYCISSFCLLCLLCFLHELFPLICILRLIWVYLAKRIASKRRLICSVDLLMHVRLKTNELFLNANRYICDVIFEKVPYGATYSLILVQLFSQICDCTNSILASPIGVGKTMLWTPSAAYRRRAFSYMRTLIFCTFTVFDHYIGLNLYPGNW